VAFVVVVCLVFLAPLHSLLKEEAQAETMARVGGVQSFLDELLHVGWIRIAMGAKNPSSSRDLGRLERA